MTPPKDSRTLLLEAISEEEFQQQVIDLATLRGWRHYHTRDSRRSAEGFPDLILARVERKLTDLQASELKKQFLAASQDRRHIPVLAGGGAGRVIFAEMKAQKGRPSVEQRAWLALLADTGKVEVYVWRPSDFDQIVEILA